MAIELKHKGTCVIKKQMASSLIEVMVGLSILAIGLLGMASLQNLALRENNNAYLYSQTIFLIRDVLDRIRSNRDQVIAYRTRYSEQSNTALDCQINHCDAAQLAKWDLADWKRQVAKLLPQGRAEITVNGARVVVVTVEFDDSRGVKSAVNISMSASI